MWSGLIPDPDSFNKYDPATRESIKGWTQAQIKAHVIDESLRQDKYTDAEIKQAKYGQMLSALIIFASIVAALIVGLCTQDYLAAGAFLVLPFATIIGNLFRPVRSKSNGHSED